MNIERLKNKLIKKYGEKPTISYYYYLWNVVDYAGEKRVRKSFKSLQGQGNEVLLGNYDPHDNTEEIAKEYGFKVLNVERKNKSEIFPESKLRNKCIYHSKSNFLLPVNINVEYPEDLTRRIINWLSKNDITKHSLRVSYKFESTKGKVRDKPYGFSYLFYKPYLLKARGYDERTFYAAGSQKYGVLLLRNIYGLKAKQYIRKEKNTIVHKYHNDVKLPILRSLFNSSISDLKSKRRKVVFKLIGNIKEDFKNIKKVKNSFW